jgi:hypothetical protein
MRGGQLLEVRIPEVHLRAHAGATKHPPGQCNQVELNIRGQTSRPASKTGECNPLAVQNTYCTLTRPEVSRPCESKAIGC